MKKFLAIALLVSGFVQLEMYAVPKSAHANSCAAKAAQLAAQRGGRVLSVRSQGKKCRGVMLVPVPNKPPRRVSFVINK